MTATKPAPGAETAGSVLVVDDSAYARLRLRRELLAEGWGEVHEASSGDEAEA